MPLAQRSQEVVPRSGQVNPARSMVHEESLDRYDFTGLQRGTSSETQEFRYTYQLFRCPDDILPLRLLMPQPLARRWSAVCTRLKYAARSQELTLTLDLIPLLP